MLCGIQSFHQGSFPLEDPPRPLPGLPGLLSGIPICGSGSFPPGQPAPPPAPAPAPPAAPDGSTLLPVSRKKEMSNTTPSSAISLTAMSPSSAPPAIATKGNHGERRQSRSNLLSALPVEIARMYRSLRNSLAMTSMLLAIMADSFQTHASGIAGVFFRQVAEDGYLETLSAKGLNDNDNPQNEAEEWHYKNKGPAQERHQSECERESEPHDAQKNALEGVEANEAVCVVRL